MPRLHDVESRLPLIGLNEPEFNDALFEMKEKDGLTFSGPVEPEKGQVETPSAFMIPSWRSVHASEEEIRRTGNPSFAGLFVLLVLVVFCGAGLSIVLNDGGILGWGLVIAGVVLSVAILAIASRRERTSIGAGRSLYFGQRDVAVGMLLVLFGLAVFIIWGESLLVTVLAVCSIAWGMFMAATTILDQ